MNSIKDLLHRFAKHLDPRVSFKHSRHSHIQFAYIGLVIQSFFIVYAPIHSLVYQHKFNLINFILNIFTAVALLEIAVMLLRGKKQNRFPAIFICALQFLYYLTYFFSKKTGPLSPLMDKIGLISSIITLYLLFSKQTKDYLERLDQGYFD